MRQCLLQYNSLNKCQNRRFLLCSLTIFLVGIIILICTLKNLFINVQHSYNNSLLPILEDTLTNRLVHDEWHTYFYRVYGEHVTNNVDLNTFMWFYNFAPLHLLSQRPVAVPKGTHHPPTQPGTLYYCTSDMICGQYRIHGYFIIPGVIIENTENREVLHHACEWEYDSSEVWF